MSVSEQWEGQRPSLSSYSLLYSDQWSAERCRCSVMVNNSTKSINNALRDDSGGNYCWMSVMCRSKLRRNSLELVELNVPLDTSQVALGDEKTGKVYERGKLS